MNRFGVLVLMATTVLILQMNGSSGQTFEEAFQEIKGLVIMEMETEPLVSPWRFERKLEGFTGWGYYKMRGNNEFLGPPVGRTSYFFHVNLPGTYRLLLRSYKDNEDSTLSNDCYTRLVGYEGYKGNDTKTYMSGPSFEWSWTTILQPEEHLDISQSFPRYTLNEGVHELQISGRARGFHIDRIVIFNERAVTEAEAKDLNIGQSRRAKVAPTVYTIIDTNFATLGDFTYFDDLFYDTDNGDYASGSLSSGGLRIELGGVDDDTVSRISGGFSTTFNLPTESDILIQFRYKVTFGATMDDGQDTRVSCSVDGTPYGLDSTQDFVAYFGGSDSNPPKNKRWTIVTVDLGTHTAGDHVFALGGFLSMKDDMDEDVTIQFDDLIMLAYSKTSTGGETATTATPTMSPIMMTTDPPTSAPSGPTSVPTLSPTSVPTSPTSVPTSGPITTTVERSVLLDSDFLDIDGFIFSRNPFRGTNVVQSHAGGFWNANKFFLAVWMGDRTDTAVVEGLSAGYRKNVRLDTSAVDVKVQFRYQVSFDAALEEGEDTEVLCSINGNLYGLPGVPDDAVEVFYGVDGPSTTGWKTVVINVGTLSAGNNEIMLGGTLSKRDGSDRVRMFFDDVLITGVPSDMTPTIIMDEDFSTYEDFTFIWGRAFRGTSNLARYSRGWWNSNGQSLVVTLGGADNALVEGMSAGHRKSFTLGSDATVVVSFIYKVWFDSTFEEGEDADVLCSIDGILYGLYGKDSVDAYYGVNDPKTTKWKRARIAIALSAGEHDLMLGGYLAAKNETSERVRIFFDNLSVTVA